MPISCSCDEVELPSEGPAIGVVCDWAYLSFKDLNIVNKESPGFLQDCGGESKDGDDVLKVGSTSKVSQTQLQERLLQKRSRLPKIRMEPELPSST